MQTPIISEENANLNCPQKLQKLINRISDDIRNVTFVTCITF